VVWFKVDDKLHDHGKAHTAGKAAMGVWVLAGSWCADNLTDGFVPARVLSRWGTTKDAAQLVKVGLWAAGTDSDGNPGWWFHDWPTYQPTKAQKVAEREARAKAGRTGGLSSGRSRREASSQANAKQVASPLLEPPSRPVPSRPVVAGSSHHLKSVPAWLDDDGVAKIRGLIGGSVEDAHRVADLILTSTSTPPRNPLAYVLRSIRNEPDRYRATDRGPKPGDPGECRVHVGQWAHTCPGCAADRKAAR
jgi:hypothetical protein